MSKESSGNSDNEPVDVLIVGAGAAGAAFAWSMADTRMKIVCLEQGDWMDPATYPTTGMDYELRGFGDMGLSPNGRGRVEDYPINDSESPIAISNFNAVGGSTILYAAHFPRFHPSDFRVKSLDGVADDWPLEVIIAITGRGEKKVGSTDGMESSASTSPYYPAWVATSESDLRAGREAILAHDFDALAEIAEHSCLKMHAAAMANRPPLIYWNPATVGCMQAITAP